MSGALPPPAARPVGQAAGAPRPLCPGCGWCWRGDPALVTQRALLRAAAARCGGGGSASPGGVPFAVVRGGRLSSGALPPPAARPLGGLSGSATHVLWARMCGCWGPALFPWLACPVGGCMPRGWRGSVPGGVAVHGREGRLVSGAVPPPAARLLGRAAWVPRPVCPGCGWCGCGDPAPAPQCAPLQAVVTRCGGGRRASPGEVPAAVPRGFWVQALPLPRLSALWAGCRGPPPMCFACRCAGVGAQHCPLGLHALWGAAYRGAGEGLSPAGVTFHRCEGRLVSGAVSPPACRPLGRAAGVPRPVCPECGWCGLGGQAPASQRAPSQAVVARCGGGRRASPGEVPAAVPRGF